MSILAIGTVAFDSIETPFGKVEKILGGSASYITLAANFFTDTVNLVAVVGEDFPNTYKNIFASRGIGIEGLKTDLSGKTFYWAGKYHYDMNMRDTLVTDLNVLATFEPEVPEAYRDAKIVCLGNLDPSIQLAVLEQMNAPELVVLDTMNFWIEKTPEALNRILTKVDVLIINDEEARQLADVPNLIKAANRILKMGPKNLIIKKGEHGALLFTGESVFSVPALPIEDVMDPTGAGDSFAGGFVGYLAYTGTYTEDDFKGAVLYGSTLASFCVEAFGPERLLELTTQEIHERVDLFRKLTEIPVLATKP